MSVPEPQAFPPPSTGLLIVVVGPSGAGKDTLMGLAAAHFAGHPRVHFVRRVITRETDAGGEDHLAATSENFDRMRDAGAFAVHWEAHGLKYGIPAEVGRQLDQGHLLIANGSRSALKHFQTAFKAMRVLNVTARPEVLAERLQARGRESREDILQRLARGGLDVQGDFDVITIDNSGSLEEAGQAMIAALDDALTTVA